MKKYILIILSISSLINILEASEQTLSTPPQSRELGEDAGFNSKTFNPSQTQPPMPSKAYTSSTLIQNQKDNNHKKTGYFDDLGTALISESTDKAIKTFTHSSIKTPVKTGKKVIGEFNDSYQETNPNATRDAFINAAIKTYIVTATTIACPLAGAILFGSKISDIHDKHYDPLKNLPPLEADDYVDRFIANNIASSLFNCGAMPYRTVNAVAHYMVKKSINAADRDGITDARIAQVLKEKQGAILQVASNVDTYFKKAPTTIARLYKEFSTTSPQPTEEEKINAARTRIQKDFQQAKERYAGNDLFEAPLASSSIDNGTLPLEQELTAADKEFIAQLITAQTQETQKQIADLTCKLISLNNDQLNQQEKEQIKEEINYAGNCAKATGDGLAVLAFMAGDRQSARKLKAFGTESQKCVTSMALMATNPVLGTIGVASSICNLIEAFEDQEEDTFREEIREMIRSIHLAIQEAVKTLSELIKNCTYEIIGEIHNVKQLIGEQHANIMQEFFKLHQSQSDTLKQMNILYSNLIKGQDFAGQHAHQEHYLTA
ncbi:hypothetical protein EBU24_01830, partial [bacterium]|nr:hypothetical protein [bacterium]